MMGGKVESSFKSLSLSPAHHMFDLIYVSKSNRYITGECQYLGNPDPLHCEMEAGHNFKDLKLMPYISQGGYSLVKSIWKCRTFETE
jgi:hypothetical protein